MKKLIFLFLFFLYLQSQEIIPGNKVDVNIKVVVDSVNEYLKFKYKIKNLLTSEQAVYMIAVILPFPDDTSKIREVTWPMREWDGVCINTGDLAWVSWGCGDSTKFILPGDSLSGFSFNTYLFPNKRLLLPDIQDFYVEGWHPLPFFSEDVPETVPGYDDLTPYGPGKVYKTVGPGPLPPGWWEYDSTVYFVSDSGFYHLIDRVNKCFEQNWLKERAKEHLIRMIERSLRHYQNNRIEESKRVLNQVISYLKKERGELVLDEAFYILYYRTRFVRDHLWWPAK